MPSEINFWVDWSISDSWDTLGSPSMTTQLPGRECVNLVTFRENDSELQEGQASCHPHAEDSAQHDSAKSALLQCVALLHRQAHVFLMQFQFASPTWCNSSAKWSKIAKIAVNRAEAEKQISNFQSYIRNFEINLKFTRATLLCKPCYAIALWQFKYMRLLTSALTCLFFGFHSLFFSPNSSEGRLRR